MSTQRIIESIKDFLVIAFAVVLAVAVVVLPFAALYAIYRIFALFAPHV